MKFHFFATLSLALLSGTDAFAAKKFNPIGFVVDASIQKLRKETALEILEGVGLPTDTENLPVGKRLTNFLQFSKATNVDVLNQIIPSDSTQKLIASIVVDDPDKDLGIEETAPRSEFFRRVYAQATNNIIKENPNDADPAEGYLYFGNRDFKKILPMLCQTNPFFASALTLSEDKQYLELIAHTDGHELKEEPLYLSLMREMTDPSHHINARFSKEDMSLVEITKFDQSGKAVVVPESEWDYYCSGILFNMLYFSSAVHANIHILHYLMCAGIIMSTRKTNDSMEKWADIFDDNIAIKHLQVAALLFDAKLAGKNFSPLGPSDIKLVSGANGFGATSKVMPKIKKMLKLWGSLKNEDDFTKKFLLKNIYSAAKDDDEAEAIMAKAGILTEFKKHLANVEPYATELTKAMSEDDKKALDLTEEKLKEFMEACGKGVSSIDSVSSWSQLMCCTGLVHGSTLSYTRLIVAPEVTRWRNINAKEWDEHDASLMGSGFATVVGMTVDRHVFTSSITNGFKWETDEISKPVMAVLDKFNEKAEKLKTDYTAEIEKRDDFREYGWILTDHCNDGYDGKQHTITTYI
jgi:hypothetical protein